MNAKTLIKSKQFNFFLYNQINFHSKKRQILFRPPQKPEAIVDTP